LSRPPLGSRAGSGWIRRFPKFLPRENYYGRIAGSTASLAERLRANELTKAGFPFVSPRARISTARSSISRECVAVTIVRTRPTLGNGGIPVASRKGFAPQVIAYWLRFWSMATWAASLISSPAAKPGNPGPDTERIKMQIDDIAAAYRIARSLSR